MRFSLVTVFFVFAFASLFNTAAKGQIFPPKPSSALDAKKPWKSSQLIESATLVSQIKNAKSKPLIFNIGVVEDIKGAKHIGGVSKEENLKSFEQALKGVPKSASVVVYCGCCPFDKCPNIRPAFNMLNRMGFTHAKLLNLPTNIKVDWIEKGYPVEK